MAKWLVRRALSLYPAAFRSRYGDEMEDAFADGWQAERSGAARVALLVRTLASLMAGGSRAWLDGVSEQLHPAHTTTTGHSPGGHMDALRQDVAFAWRSLRRRPTFVALVLGTLGLGIGVNTAVFSVLYGALFQSLGYANEDAIVRVGRTHPSFPGGQLPLSPANWLDLREGLTTLTALEVVTPQSFVLTDRGDAGRHAGAAASAGFFDLLGVEPAQGRTFRPEDDVDGAPAVAVLSDAFWRAQLGADPSVVGTQIRLNDEPHTVIGIMPPDFDYARQQLWTPLQLTEQQRAVRGSNSLFMLGRLAPGTTVAQATSELATRWTPLKEAFPVGNEETGMSAQPLRDAVRRNFQRPLVTLLVAAAFVLLIACVNVANLLLVRAERRQREVGVRAALGAGRGRLVSQFLMEGMLLSLLGGVLGVAIAFGALKGLVSTFGSAVPRADAIGISTPVLLFSLGASLLTGLLVGLIPGLRARPDFELLREGARGGTARLTRLGRTLVVVEVALALMLVTGAGLLLKSYQHAVDSQLGFDARGLAAVTLWFPPTRYADNAQRQTFMDRLLPEVEARPAVAGVTLASMVPVREFGSNWTEVGVTGRDDAKASFVEGRSVAPDYFETMAIPLETGRLLTDSEARDPQSTVILINRTLARQLFGDDSPLGWTLDLGGPIPQEIVGVVGDVRDFGPDQTTRPMIYFPSSLASNLILRASAGTGDAVRALRAAVQAIDPQVAVIRVDEMSAILDTALSGRRFQLSLLAVFAVTALLLACVGIYGVLSYSVERQMREIGVRMALGAHAGRVAGLVAWRGGRLALIGIGVGGIGAFALRRAIESQLFEVQSFDPFVYAGVALILLAVAAVASFLPAHRASRVQPTHALRIE